MRTLQKKNFVFLSLLFVMFLASCTSYKQVPYLQNSREWAGEEQPAVYEAKIRPNDLLNIIVTNPDNPTTSLAYNLVSPSESSTPHSYLVDSDGNVTIPNIGKVNICGMTVPEAELYILDKVQGAFSSTPVVIVRFANFKISVLGEVARPGIFNIENGKVSIFEALALAGDLSIYGLRDNVKIIREDGLGKKEVVELNLNDASVLKSPYYYLQQNDVVYVTPNESKAKNSDVGTGTQLLVSGTSILVSLISLLYNILR